MKEEMTVQKEISIETPAGKITATVSGTPDEYPGIRISVNGTTYVFVEYDNVKESTHIVTYDETSDDPKEIYDLPK